MLSEKEKTYLSLNTLDITRPWSFQKFQGILINQRLSGLRFIPSPTWKLKQDIIVIFIKYLNVVSDLMNGTRFLNYV